jgi:synaptosomal-associated protein 25
MIKSPTQISAEICLIPSSQVSAMIGNLRNMASDMNGELDNQNSQLDRINLKASSDITRVKMANDKAAQLMK